MPFKLNPFTGALDLVRNGLAIGDPIPPLNGSQVLFTDAAGNLAQDIDFFWDDGVHQLTLGGGSLNALAYIIGLLEHVTSAGDTVFTASAASGGIIFNPNFSATVGMQIFGNDPTVPLFWLSSSGNSITFGDDLDLGGTVGFVAQNTADTTIIVRQLVGQTGKLTSWQGSGLNQLIGVNTSGEVEFGTTSQGVKVSGFSAGYISFKGYGNTNNEELQFDFESIANTVSVVTTTGVTTFAFNSIDVTVPDEAYGVGWNGSLEVPTKNAIYDKIETIGGTVSGSFGLTIDGGGSAITTGLKGYVSVPYDMTITGWDIFADQSGSIVVDVWKDTYANFPPIAGDSIAGTEKPTLSAAQKNQDASLSTWTTSVTAGDVIAFNVDSAATVTRVTVVIYGNRT